MHAPIPTEPMVNVQSWYWGSDAVDAQRQAADKSGEQKK